MGQHPGGGPRNTGGQQVQLPDKNTIVRIIGGDTDLLVREAERLGPLLSQASLTTSQIRNIYGMVKKMELTGYESNRGELLLLKPKLAYAAARPGAKQGTGYLKQVLTTAIDCVSNEAQFEQFVNFFEAILAYHRAAGGK